MKKTILLVDDESDIREVLGLPLTDLGYRVCEAESGSQALEIFRDKQPSIVLTDIKMPGMDGIELLQKIKHENPETEVIMITGHGDMDLAIRSLKHQAIDFITKPINVDALEIAVQRAKDKIITREKLQEYTENLENLIREKTELQSHLASLGLMIGSISHGIKGLLTGLDGGMYILNSGIDKDDQDQVTEGWAIVKVMVERIRKMVMDILFYAKDRELKYERIHILTFSDEVARELEPQVKAQQIEFEKEFDSIAGDFEADAAYVHSALVNIIDNAIDACTCAQSPTASRIVFGVREHKNGILFEISDNGIGMDADTLNKIFTPLFSSKGRKGTGLGLFISNTIIEQHGGRIKVESTPGRGTHFQIEIPRNRPRKSTPKSRENVP
jgi:signal transduction histidine kinase